MPLDAIRMVVFDDSPEAHILVRVWRELGGSRVTVARSASRFADALRSLRPDEVSIVMTHGGTPADEYTDEAGHTLAYVDAPPITAGALYGFSCFQEESSPLRGAETALLCRDLAGNLDLVSLLFALANAPDPFDVQQVANSVRRLPSTWYVHTG